MNKICVIKTGGTIGSTAGAGVVALDSEKRLGVSELYNGNGVEFDVFSPFALLSENISSENLQDMLAFVKSIDKSKYDGIILTHGTDTLAFSGVYLALNLENISLPIVMVSANFPVENPKSNGKTNFACGVEFILQCGEAGVFVSYQNPKENCKIHRGELILQCRGAEGLFESFGGEIFGKFDCDMKFQKNINHICGEKIIDLWKNSIPNFKKIPACNGDIKNKVLPIKAVSFCDYSLFNLENCDAIIVESFHSGTVKTSGINSIITLANLANEKNIPLIISGASNGDIYESISCLKNLANVILFPGSFEFAYIVASQI